MVSFCRNIIIGMLLIQSTFAQNMPWKPTITNTSSKLVFNCIPFVNDQPISSNDYIGVFDSIGNFYGLGRWNDTIDYNIDVYGSDGVTDALKAGARLKFKIWLRDEDCIVENLTEISSDTDLVFVTANTNRINIFKFEKTTITYPKQEYCLNAEAIRPVINYKPNYLQFSSNSGLEVDSISGIIHPEKCTPGIYTISLNANRTCLTR